jgi:hypothetical protein
MNPQLMRLMKLHRLYREPAGEGGSDDGGTGQTPEQIAAAAKAAKDAEDAAAAAAAAAKGKPTDAEAKLLKDVMKHKQAAEAATTKAAEIEAQLKKFEGIDPEKVRELLAKQAEEEAKRADEERKAAEARGEYDRLVKQMGERHTAEKQTLEQQILAERNDKLTLAKQIAEMTVGAAFTSSTLVREELTLTPAKARVIYGTHFEFKDGHVVGYDKPTGASDRTMLVDAAGKPLEFEAALRTLVETDPDKDQLFKSKVKPGAGSGAPQAKGAQSAQQSAVDPALKGTDRIVAGLRAKALAK